MTINSTEEQERQYLEEIKSKIDAALSEIDQRVNRSSRDLQAQKQYIWENKGEKNAMNDAILQVAATGEAALSKKIRLHKLMASPYFGRIDFMEDIKTEQLPVYIGVHSFFDDIIHENLVHDWRAPISSMFYDFELGKAYFEAPSGKVDGRIILKRQYRIRNGKMDFMLENSTHIQDDILQEELSRSSDEKMKNIISTIQKDQNAIIRNEKSGVLIIQGVAGSGKTSIALHRIAFLLYRFKDTVSSKNILIISPNKVFADYISNVLPELGEEKIPEMGIDELATSAFEHKYKFQTFFEQVALLLEKNDAAFLSRIQFKSSFEFLGQLNGYVAHIINEYFTATDLLVKRYTVSGAFIADKFEAYHRLPLLKRFPQMATTIAEHVRIRYKYELNAKERNEIRRAVTRMFRITNLKDLYKDFFLWLGKPELYKMASGSTLEYADVFPLLYLKMRLEGSRSYDQVKHLLIDEMQDYTPVQYAVLAKLFICKKTILGDTGQSVNPYSSSDSARIQRAFPGADFFRLNKSYRSTYEITQFAQRIFPNKDLIAVERHGDKPAIHRLENNMDEIDKIKGIIGDFKRSDYRSLGIICKTQKQADWLHGLLTESQVPVYLLTAQSTRFAEGVILTTAHLAKGLEFDQVIAPFSTSDNYKTVIDKSMLYVACTRAMHQLDITYAGEITLFLAKADASRLVF